MTPNNTEVDNREPPTANAIEEVVPEIGQLPAATDELLKARALQKRVDIKFVLGVRDLRAALGSLEGEYAIALAGGRRVAEYRTLYFDTRELFFAREHVRGRRPRHKVRIRHYTDRELTFLEVKRKTAGDETVKKRRLLPYGLEVPRVEDSLFIDQHSPIPAERLVPSARTDFRRITLVGLGTHERVTIDLDLAFEAGTERSEMGGAVIVEVKQARYSPRSPVLLALRSAGVRPRSISKYCAAVSVLFPEARMKAYLPRLRALRKVSNG